MRAALRNDPEAFIKRAAERAPGDPMAVTVRELLSVWGARKRGTRVVARIRADLSQAGLMTEPDFQAWFLDAPVWIREAAAQPPESSVAESTDDSSIDLSPDSQRLRVGNLASAVTELVSVTRSDEIGRAIALMIRHDYSQLAVLEGERGLKGAVSWESVGRAQLRGACATVADALVLSEPVRFDADLLTLVPRIVDSGFVFVEGPDKKITGIATTADLSMEFLELSTPFFQIGEIERRLRVVVDKAFPPDQLKAACDPSNPREIEGAADLTLGEVELWVQKPENWEPLEIAIDRKVFLDALTKARDIRNGVMHFSPDPPDEDDIEDLRAILRLLRQIEPS